jgi:hypothetical protein
VQQQSMLQPGGAEVDAEMMDVLQAVSQLRGDQEYLDDLCRYVSPVFVKRLDCVAHCAVCCCQRLCMLSSVCRGLWCAVLWHVSRRMH